MPGFGSPAGPGWEQTAAEGKTVIVRKVLTSWYVIAPLVAGLGIAVGLLVFVYAFPGKPKIGVIDVPFTVISDDSAYVIGEYLDYAGRDDSIKAVVIRLTSPGGGAAASERLYLETRKLREEKPVVLVMNGLVASGGFMMAMGASHSYAQPSSLVGNVGVITVADPLVPPLPDESLIFTGPYKLSGASRREWIGMTDQIKSAFAQLVTSERGDRLRITTDELIEGRIYSGMDAVRLGLADEIGGNSDAVQKAAEMAGVSSYGLVDVNAEVLREFVQKLNRIFPSSDSGADSSLAEMLALLSIDDGSVGLVPDVAGVEPGSDIARLQALRSLIISGNASEEDPLPGFPLDIHRPNIYYLYVGHAP